MKKLLSIAAFILLMIPVMGQMPVMVTGTITDSATGNPIPNYPVTIYSDSTFGLVYYNTVYTSQNGYYADTIWTTTFPGLLYVHVLDCVQSLHEDTCYFTVGFETFVVDFSICYSNTPTCDAEFTWNASIPLTVYFTDLSTNPGGIWNWWFGDGTTSSLQHPVHTYSLPGTYSVQLMIGDSTICSDYVTHSVVVQDSTGGGCQADYIFIPDSIDPMLIRFFDNSTGNIIYWSWNFGDPPSGVTNVSSLENPTHIFSSPGFYTVCLTVQGADSSCYDTYCETILVGSNTGCQAQFTYYLDTIPSQGGAVQFIDLSTGTPVNWNWDFGDGSPNVTDQNPMHIYPVPGIYYVCLTIQCQGVTSTWCMNVDVTPLTNCNNYFTYSGVDLTMAYSGYMVYGQPADFYWNFGDGQTATGQTATHTYAAAGIYYVSLSTVDTSGCQHTSAQSVMVGDSGQFHQVYGQVFSGSFPTTPGFVMILGIDTTQNYFPYVDIANLDSNGVYYFPMVPTGSYYIYAIPFDSPDNFSPTYYGDVLFWSEATLVTLPQANNPYDIHLVQGGNYIPGPGNINGQINTGDFVAGLVDKITMMMMDENNNVLTFSDVSSEGAFTFPEVAYGTYYLHAEMAGCTSDRIMVEISEQNPDVNVVLTFSGGSILGVNDRSAALDAGIVYPNPVRDEANIRVNTLRHTVLTAEVIDLTGRIVRKTTESVGAGSHTITIPVSGIPSGMYTLRIYSVEGLSAAKKLVISK